MDADSKIVVSEEAFFKNCKKAIPQLRIFSGNIEYKKRICG
jgi:hypothetical protein